MTTSDDNPPPSSAGASQEAVEQVLAEHCSCGQCSPLGNRDQWATMASLEAVARIARMHFYTGNGRCGCGWVYSVERIDEDWATHVAAELMKLWEAKP